jgi:hypothetical protein
MVFRYEQGQRALEQSAVRAQKALVLDVEAIQAKTQELMGMIQDQEALLKVWINQWQSTLPQEAVEEFLSIVGGERVQ